MSFRSLDSMRCKQLLAELQRPSIREHVSFPYIRIVRELRTDRHRAN